MKSKTAPRSARAANGLIAGLLGLVLAAVPAGAQDYHRFAEVESALGEVADAHPGLLTLIDAGSSAGGRTLWVARIAADGPLDPDQRPAIFVGANAAGFHNVGTEAALHLARTLAEGAGEHAHLLAHRTFYVAPVLNPDAHDTYFADLRWRRSGNAQSLDHDRDGLLAEDGHDDLDGDGRITHLRIADPTGDWLPHPEEPRLMVQADAEKGWIGTHRLLGEGADDDGDGEYNEDGAEGVAVDRNFPHAHPFPEAKAGLFPGSAPEVHALFEFLFARRHVALAVIYGPANNFLEAPKSLGGGGGDLGTQKFKIPPQIAEFMGFDPEQEYTIDEVWEVAQNFPFVRQNNITKAQLAQFLGAGPATKLEDDDQKLIASLAEDYEKRLEDAGLDKERPAIQYAKGGITPWLYYQYGVLALELDVWGVPKPAKEEEEGEEEEKKLTVEALADMSAEDFLAFGEEAIAAFMKEAGVPAQFSAAMVIQRVEAGQITPAQMAQMIQQSGGGGGGDNGDDSPKVKRQREVLAWLDANHPEAIAPWTEVTLASGEKAEAGGLDPFAELAPPYAMLAPAFEVHTATVLDLASKIARLEIVHLGAEALGGGVYRVKAVLANRGDWATHTRMAVRARSQIPVRLELELGDGVSLLTGQNAVTADRLQGPTGTLEGEWLVKARPGTTIRVRGLTDQAGRTEKTHVLEGGSR